MPEAGPFGATRLEARLRAIVDASFVNRPSGGWVESVLTLADQRFFVADLRLRTTILTRLRRIVNATLSFDDSNNAVRGGR